MIKIHFYPEQRNGFIGKLMCCSCHKWLTEISWDIASDLNQKNICVLCEDCLPHVCVFCRYTEKASNNELFRAEKRLVSVEAMHKTRIDHYQSLSTFKVCSLCQLNMSDDDKTFQPLKLHFYSVTKLKNYYHRTIISIPDLIIARIKIFAKIMSRTKQDDYKYVNLESSEISNLAKMSLLVHSNLVSPYTINNIRHMDKEQLKHYNVVDGGLCPF